MKDPAASLEGERERTDAKLREERARVDELLETATAAAHVLDAAPGEATEALEEERAGVDEALAEVTADGAAGGAPTPAAKEPILEAVAAERAKADEIIAYERLRAEELVRLERERCEAETLRLERERQETDRSLGEERRTTDQTIVAHVERLHVVSHDLRNPLQSIVASAQVVRSAASSTDPAVEERLRRAAERINRAASAMDRLVGDLLTNAALDLGSLPVALARHDVGELAEEVVRALEPMAASRRLRLEARVATPVPVHCDSDRISQVLSNLVGNAIKFATEGSLVELEVTRAGEEVLVAVRNQGPGVAEQDLPHLFERHFRGADAREGLGLGLHIAKALVEAHGGRIWHERAPDGRTAFVFSLPVNR